jgi:uncharacterized protein (TIGR02453 family)
MPAKRKTTASEASTAEVLSQFKSGTFSSPPAFEGVTAAGFEFLAQLAANNDREWFQAHKQTYQQALQAPFVSFIEAMSARLEGSGMHLQGSKASVFRLHRDTRFSRDKTPYKTHLGGVLSYSGSKQDRRGILYIQFGVDGGFVASGFYQPDSEVLGAIRDAIAQSPETALSITNSLAAQQLPLQATESLKRLPRGFEAQSDPSVAELLKMKDYIMRKALSPELWQGAQVIEVVAQFAQDTYPWVAFGREAIPL